MCQKSKVRCVCVYIKEAHPCDEWKIYSHVDYNQPKTLEERCELAQKTYALAKRDNLFDPFVDVEDEANSFFSAWPERLYCIEDLRVVYKGGTGPDDYKPKELEEFLLK